MCHKGTIRGCAVLLPLVMGMAQMGYGQTSEWRKVGGSAVEIGLAAPATGPVESVWFSPDGASLYARTHSSRVFVTTDFETWTPSAEYPAPIPFVPVADARVPEPRARVVSAAWDPARYYALGRQLFRSEDGGKSWVNLTAFKSVSVIGPGQNSLAVSPGNPQQLVVANGYGVWRSMDGGLSWTGLNLFLPDLPIRRILATPGSAHGTRAVADGRGVIELPPGTAVWLESADASLDNEEAQIERAAAVIGAEITAVASSGYTVYAGSADGRLWVSVDGGRQFQQTDTPAGTSGRVERIFFDGRVALAALSGKAPHVLRNTNTMRFWDALDGNLPDASAHGIAADRASGAVYVATDKGVFWATTDLENPSGSAVAWTNVSDKLPQVAAADVRLDPAGVQLYAALDGYGVYATAAPHRQRNIRIVNAADYSTRAAAPGSLLSVIGGRVDSARAGSLDYPVLAVVGSESQIQVPFEAVGPTVALALEMAGGTVRREVAVQPVSPAILVGRDGVPMLWDADSGLPLDVRTPAHSNGRLQIWATGLGKVRPDWPTGLPAPLENPPVVAAQVRAFVDGSPVQVTSARLLPGYVGFYLVEVQLPAINNAGPTQLYISADGQESNRVLVTIEP